MSSISTEYGNYSNRPTGSVKKNEKVSEKTNDTVKSESTKSAEASEKRTDKFERTGSSSVKNVAVDYRKKSNLGIKNEGMKDTIAQLLGQSKKSGSKSGPLDIESVLRQYGVEPIESDGSEDFWGAEKTANRILDFAKSLAGNNKEAFSKLRGAFEQAFGECEKIWGGRLPDVSYDTYDRVQKGFDDIEKELSDKSSAEG